MKWISVDERLPEKLVEVSVHDPDHPLVRIGYYSRIWEGEWRSLDARKIDPTHWMPYPDPPEAL